MAEGDEVYLKLREQMSVRVGTEFSVFQPLGSVVHPTTDAVLGQKVRMKGVVKVIGLGEKTVRARIESSFSEIERGSPIMAVQNHRLTVQPTQNLIDLSAVVVDSLTKKQEQDSSTRFTTGRKDGVKIGNRFFVVRRGDGRHELGDKRVRASQNKLVKHWSYARRGVRAPHW